MTVTWPILAREVRRWTSCAAWLAAEGVIPGGAFSNVPTIAPCCSSMPIQRLTELFGPALEGRDAPLTLLVALEVAEAMGYFTAEAASA